MSIGLFDSQIPWEVDNVRGHSIDPSTMEIDGTEGFGAFDSILRRHTMGTRIVDIGGGKYDDNIAYCRNKYLIDLSVYDPFMRDEVQNKKVLKEEVCCITP